MQVIEALTKRLGQNQPAYQAQTKGQLNKRAGL